MKNNTAGFTLIELLIVIAIIGILAAVLIPNLLGARDRARDAAAQACASELMKQAEIYQIDKNTYDGFNGTGDYAPGTACNKDTANRQVADWTVKGDVNSVSGTVTSLSKKGTVFNFDNKSGITRAAAAPASN